MTMTLSFATLNSTKAAPAPSFQSKELRSVTEIDLKVMDLIQKNNNSSAEHISSLSKIPFTQVQDSFCYWQDKGVIHMTNFGYVDRDSMGCHSTGPVRVLKVVGPYADKEATDTDVRVLNLLRKNKGTSIAFLAHVSSLSQSDILTSIRFWQSKNKVVRNGSDPVRYYTNKKVIGVELDSVDQDQEPYQYGISVYYMDDSHDTNYLDAASIMSKYMKFMSAGDLSQLEELENQSMNNTSFDDMSDED